MEDGLYDQLIDAVLAEALSEISASQTRQVEISGSDLDSYLSSAVAKRMAQHLASLDHDQLKIQAFNAVIDALDGPTLADGVPRVLRGLVASPTGNLSVLDAQPAIPLAQPALLTNAKGEPRIGSELATEILSAARVDILMAFVKQTGLNLIAEQLRSLRDRGIEVRLITSAYMGATEPAALMNLVSEFNVQVRVDYLARANRLHAKAWLIERSTGYGTAYIGSSNLSRAAMVDGLEWNVRLTEQQSPELLDKVRIAFETYWNSSDFLPFTGSAEDLELLEEALHRAKQYSGGSAGKLTIANLDVRPWPFQQKMLDDLEVERQTHGRHRNLLIAATGSGKTVMAALDYKRLKEVDPKRRLLFIAHTKEILEQARATFAQVLRDPEFGELLVDGNVPRSNLHVFASIQSLSSKQRFQEFSPSQFEVVIIDEFHHAEAKTYRQVIDHFKPEEFLALTATPERSDGVRVQDVFFNGRVASELRLWDALDQEILTPFSYFGIFDDVDYKKLTWSGGKYESRSLSNLLTGNEVRARLIVQQLTSKFGDLSKLRAIAFCVSVEHARFMEKYFTLQGLHVRCVLGETDAVSRAESIRLFRNGELQILLAVDVFNEGFDAPDANAILMLRPTESPLIFLQQLGRGLRKSVNKESVLVLDFVGNHRVEYRQDLRLTILTGRHRGELARDLRDGFPYLPSGVSIQLDRKTREHVLASLRDQVAPSSRKLADEIQSLGSTDFAAYLEKSGREPWEIYRSRGDSWSKLSGQLQGEDHSVFAHLARNLIHVNDAFRASAYLEILKGNYPRWHDASDSQRRALNMFVWNLFPDGQSKNSIDQTIAMLQKDSHFVSEASVLLSLAAESAKVSSECLPLGPLTLPLVHHANYTRAELLAATGWCTAPNSEFESVAKEATSAKPSDHREGVAWLPGLNLDLLFVTLQKGAGFSATTRYHDYAESREVFHWDSQNATSADSPTGLRYRSQSPKTSHVLLALRETSEADGGFTQTYRMCGFMDYMKHVGSRPMQIWWQLRKPLDLETWQAASAVRVA